MDRLVSTAWLAAELGKPDLVVFDATKYMPADGKDGRTEFAAAHIPGAHFFDIDEVADQDTSLPHMVPTAGRFAKLMQQLGVAQDSRVVFYDQKGMASAPRGWWLLRLFGHQNVAVLDGGLPKWQAESRAVENGAAAPTPATQPYVPDLHAELMKGIGDMKALVGAGKTLVLDARSKGRFDGSAPEPRPGLPSGHMPGAANVPFNELLAPDQTFLPPDQLRARFAAAGVDGSRPLVTSCGTGVTATILALGLLQAGLPEAAVYDGSWTEWAGRPETPKVKS